jgi:hypothetical protein
MSTAVIAQVFLTEDSQLSAWAPLGVFIWLSSAPSWSCCPLSATAIIDAQVDVNENACTRGLVDLKDLHFFALLKNTAPHSGPAPGEVNGLSRWTCIELLTGGGCWAGDNVGWADPALTYAG